MPFVARQAVFSTAACGVLRKLIAIRIVRVHQADRDGEIDELALLEDPARGFIGLIRHAGIRNAGHRFGPCEGGALARVEQIAGFLHACSRAIFSIFTPLLSRSRICMSRQ